MGYGSTRSMCQRALGIVILIVILFGASGINLVRHMLINSSFYQKKAAMQQLQDTEISAKRGDIYDRNMEVLATSAPRQQTREEGTLLPFHGSICGCPAEGAFPWGPWG